MKKSIIEKINIANIVVTPLVKIISLNVVPPLTAARTLITTKASEERAITSTESAIKMLNISNILRKILLLKSIKARTVYPPQVLKSSRKTNTGKPF